MKNWKEIAEQQRENIRRMDELTIVVQKSPWSKKTEPEIVKAAQEIELLKIENRILQDNKRVSYVAEKLPGILEIVNKYAGKPYGPKTKDKMQAEAKEKLSCSFFLEQDQYSAALNIIPLDDRGYSGNVGFSYNQTDLRTIYAGENREALRVLDENNKIVARAADDYNLTGGPEYVENTRERAEQIVEKFNALKEIEKTFDGACSSLNILLPSGIEHVYANNFRGYLNY